MKKTIFSMLGFIALSTSVLAQSAKIDPTNCREGETVEYCGTHKKMQEFYVAHPEAYQEHLQEMEQQDSDKGTTPSTDGGAITKATVYYIPIVFHVLHNNGSENISDEQILDALSIMNRDYRLQNADANNVHPDFASLPSDIEVEFRLATIAPNGQCFSGITRTVDPITNDGSSGVAQVNAIINGNDVYNGQWPGDEYLNVFICGEIGGAAGYTYLPSNWIGDGMNNGIWVLHNYVGSIGTSSTFTSRTLTHEAGHWLNLDHPWGGNNNPGNASSCSSDDGVSDTPNTIGVTTCNLNENSCGPRANVENYMDYSYCSKMFTPGQKARIRTALVGGLDPGAIQNTTANRDNLVRLSNLTATGATGTTYLCEAAFSADRTTICAGDAIQFDDQSFNAVNGWNWTFTGGTPASSTAENPSVTYMNEGIYAVTLTATDGSNNDTETKTAYIKVLPSGASLPFHDSFEDYATLNNIDEWEISNSGGNGWQLNSSTGYTGTKSAKLTNFGQSAGETDMLTSAPVDLSGVNATDGVTLSFRYSHKKRSSANNECLKVFISSNCGENWAQRKTLCGNTLSTDVQSSQWTPSSQADWETVHMTNVTSSYWTEKFQYRFVFESDAGNNVYLDDINIYEGSPSDDIVALDENALDIETLSVFPNPSEDELNVRFSLVSDANTTLAIKDITGKEVKAKTIFASNGSNLVMLNTSDLAQGMYFLTVQVGASQKTIQFVAK